MVICPVLPTFAVIFLWGLLSYPYSAARDYLSWLSIKLTAFPSSRSKTRSRGSCNTIIIRHILAYTPGGDAPTPDTSAGQPTHLDRLSTSHLYVYETSDRAQLIGSRGAGLANEYRPWLLGNGRGPQSPEGRRLSMRASKRPMRRHDERRRRQHYNLARHGDDKQQSAKSGPRKSCQLTGGMAKMERRLPRRDGLCA